jgi:hypothetical protein
MIGGQTCAKPAIPVEKRAQAQIGARRGEADVRDEDFLKIYGFRTNSPETASDAAGRRRERLA